MSAPEAAGAHKPIRWAGAKVAIRESRWPRLEGAEETIDQGEHATQTGRGWRRRLPWVHDPALAEALPSAHGGREW